MQFKVIVYQRTSYIIVKRNVEVLLRNEQIQLYKLYACYAYEVNVKNCIWYIIVPKGAKFTGSGKLRFGSPVQLFQFCSNFFNTSQESLFLS